MRVWTTLVAAVVTVVLAVPAQSRDDRLRFPLNDALENANAQGKLDAKVKLYFGDQSYPNPERQFGTFTANRKTNFANKSDKDACEWAFLTAVVALQERAKREGGNAGVKIKSVYRNGNFSSAIEYECGAGNVTGGVALQGEVVTLP